MLFVKTNVNIYILIKEIITWFVLFSWFPYLYLYPLCTISIYLHIVFYTYYFRTVLLHLWTYLDDLLKIIFPITMLWLLKSATCKYNYLKERGSKKKQNPHVVQRFKWWNTCGIDREEIGNWQYIGDVGI